MTLLTEDGRGWYGQKTIDAVTTRIDAIAVGTGSGSEDFQASALGNEVYRADYTTSNVEFNAYSSSGELIGTIQVTGGTEIPADTGLTEMAFFAGGSGGGGTMIWVDEFEEVVIPSGRSRMFEMEIDHFI